MNTVLWDKGGAGSWITMLTKIKTLLMKSKYEKKIDPSPCFSYFCGDY